MFTLLFSCSFSPSFRRSFPPPTSVLLPHSSACARVRLLLANTLAPRSPSPSSSTAENGIAESSFENLDRLQRKASSSGAGGARRPPVEGEEEAGGEAPLPFPPPLLVALPSFAVIPPHRNTPPVASDRSAIAPASAPMIERNMSTASAATWSVPRAAAAVMAGAETRGESTVPACCFPSSAASAAAPLVVEEEEGAELAAGELEEPKPLSEERKA